MPTSQAVLIFTPNQRFPKLFTCSLLRRKPSFPIPHTLQVTWESLCLPFLWVHACFIYQLPFCNRKDGMWPHTCLGKRLGNGRGLSLPQDVEETESNLPLPSEVLSPSGLQKNMATAFPSSLADLRVLKPLLANQALRDKRPELIHLTMNLGPIYHLL